MKWIGIGIALLALFISKESIAQACYEASIVSPSPFMGNNNEVFKLSDGSIWEVKYEYEYMYEYSPNVIICPAKGKLVINGKQLNVERLSVGRQEPARPKPPAPPTGLPRVDREESTVSRPQVIESQIEGEFTGWDGETIFKLVNGQIWQQSTYAYTYSYKYRPKVMIISISSGVVPLAVEPCCVAVPMV